MSTNQSGPDVAKRSIHQCQLRHVRYREQQGGVEFLEPPTLITITVIGNGSSGTPKSFLLEHMHFKYMFNCGEGVQKIAQEHKMKLAKAEHVFITHKHWKNLGGLLGMALSVQEANLPKLTLYGPPLVEEIIDSARSFATLNKLTVEKFDLMQGVYSDPAFEIHAVPLVTSTTSASLQNNDDHPAAKRSRLSNAECVDHDIAYAYVCKPHPTKGKLDLHRCVELGVPRGKLFKELKDGKSIILENGKTVNPEDVIISDTVKSPLIVVDCPSLGHLDSLLHAEELQKWQSHDNVNQNAQVVVHFTPPSIMSHPKYQQWLARFGSDTDHLILNGNGTEIANLGVYKLQSKLNLVHSRIFPLLYHQKTKIEDKNADANLEAGNEKPPDDKFVVGETKLTYHMRPKHGFSRENCVKVDTEQFQKETLDLPLVEDLIRESQQAIQALQKDEVSESLFPEIVFLGTGSSIPNKVRSVSAILLHLSDEKCILLDCGEGTFGQIYRLYGDRTDQILRGLQCIYVSHMHADHHLGISGIIEERKKALMRDGQKVTPLTLLAPYRYEHWLRAYDKTISPITDDMRLVPLQIFLPTVNKKKWNNNYMTNYEEFVAKMNEMGLSSIEAVEVMHCHQAFGVVITVTSGWRCVYSGDTVPCQALVEAGKDCDVLIHEATMEDDLEDKALLKRHSTTSQAIDIGLKMKAKFTLLTHFSQRYAKIPIFNDKFTEQVGIAFDNMCLRPSDLKIIPQLREALTAVFQEEYAELLDKSDKRMWKRQLLEAEEKIEEEKRRKYSSTDPKCPPSTSSKLDQQIVVNTEAKSELLLKN